MIPFVPRTLEATVARVSRAFPVLLVTGPRQVGKTTLLRHCAGTDRDYVTLDDPNERALAAADPELLLQRHPGPVLIDEVQYAPSLFPILKLWADRLGTMGRFWLTGSQRFDLMRGLSESLAGRIGILELGGLSQAEMAGRAHTEPFAPTEEWVSRARLAAPGPQGVRAVYERIWRGGLPRIALDPEVPRDVFYGSYVQTYLQRDVRAITGVADELAFVRFLRATAARTGQLLSYRDLARDVDIDPKTAKSWMSALLSTGLAYLLAPWHGNVTCRLVKTPKLYFLDTGLAAYLTQWTTAASLEAGAMSGAILETYVLAEILKSFQNQGRAAPLYFYRDRDGHEVDLLIERDDTLFPVEIKKTASPSARMVGGFASLGKLGRTIGPGAVVCLRERDVPLSREVVAIPTSYL